MVSGIGALLKVLLLVMVPDELIFKGVVGVDADIHSGSLEMLIAVIFICGLVANQFLWCTPMVLDEWFMDTDDFLSDFTCFCFYFYTLCFVCTFYDDIVLLFLWYFFSFLVLSCKYLHTEYQGFRGCV